MMGYSTPESSDLEPSIPGRPKSARRDRAANLRRVAYVVLAAGLLQTSVLPANEEEMNVILPLEAQTCNLPSAPARIPADADYDALVKAKGEVSKFQAAMEAYRNCLGKAGAVEGLTDGNQVALNQAHNYSVEMEERIAEQFNVAVRAYKARQAQSGEQ